MEKKSVHQFTGIIPARYASSRFPGKPIVMIGNRTMVQRVYEQAMKSIDNVYVATDDHRIYDVVIKFGGKAVMTSPEHMTGTDRCAEAADKIAELTGEETEVVINIQGDEPFIKPGQIDLLKSCFSDSNVKIATLIRKTVPGEDIFNPNQPKVILDSEDNAIYFSRTAIPYIRDADLSTWSENHVFYKHIGLYAYRMETLKQITKLKRSQLEIAENLEQNRWIENGIKIKTAVTEWESIGVDTPDDLKKVILLFDHFI
ncbi:MAG: 3-deoxy-manno-octulosonate cytidylyltransferase [Bacteroidales bacterium]|jgi:3-deoxy-manno-octulosonate cytidylyltransferase (CMP-KDO synthetase)|nr:3-deoxy-manno-octulosonate cytidylyltransferase [Bacteroidales bacterium]